MCLKLIFTYLAQDPGHFNTILIVRINIYFSEKLRQEASITHFEFIISSLLCLSVNRHSPKLIAHSCLFCCS